jgi:hypothetical protein
VSQRGQVGGALACGLEGHWFQSQLGRNFLHLIFLGLDISLLNLKIFNLREIEMIPTDKNTERD